jgi:cell division protein FtsZ
MINLDFNDVKTVITEGGDAMIGVGSHKGENRSLEAAKKAISSPLLEDVSIEGARGALINITSSSNLTLYEANEAASIIQESAGHDANIIFGTVIDEDLVDEMRVTVIATGFYLNKRAGRYENLEEKAVSKRQQRTLQEAMQPEFGGFSRAASEDAEEKDSTWNGDLDYPAILRNKMA